jgi:flagellin-like hook-associated protein FlgL
MSSDVSLTSALRSNLLSLQNTQRQIDTTQGRLATGLKVQSALDNPLNFFRSESFSNRASDLTNRLDGIGLSIRTIQEADNGVSAINDLLDAAEGIVEGVQAAYNGTGTNVAFIQGLETATGGVTTATTLDAISGGISGFAAAGDTIDVTIDGVTVQVAGNGTVQDLINAFETGGLLTATFSATDGTLSIDVDTAGGSEVSDLDDVSITITDSDGSGTTSAPAINFGGTIVRDSSGETSIYAGIKTDIESFEERYNKILTEVSATAADSSFNGINLLNGNDLLTIFNEDGTSNLSTVGQDLSASGLGLSFADFSSSSSTNSIAAELDTANQTVRNFGGALATDIQLIQTRETFTRETVQTLQSGSDDLVLADLNEEGANLLALQTRQQLGVTSLSLASQAQQGVLRLF